MEPREAELAGAAVAADGKPYAHGGGTPSLAAKGQAQWQKAEQLDKGVSHQLLLSVDRRRSTSRGLDQSFTQLGLHCGTTRCQLSRTWQGVLTLEGSGTCPHGSFGSHRRSCWSSLGLVWLKPGLSGQATGQPSTRNGEWPHYTADMTGHALLAARSDQRVELQQARGRLAVQDRQPRSVPRVQARRHAADDQGRALHDRRHAPLGRRARRQDRRADLDAQPARRQARRGVAAPAVGPRRRRTGPTARATSASSTSRPATGSSSSTRRPAR